MLTATALGADRELLDVVFAVVPASAAPLNPNSRSAEAVEAEFMYQYESMASQRWPS